MTKQITNKRTLRGKLRRMQADADAMQFTASNGFSGCSTKRVCVAKARGANHKKLSLERSTKHYAMWSAL